MGLLYFRNPICFLENTMRLRDKILLKVLSYILDLIIIIILLVSGLLSGFALWDNQNVYAMAENVQEQMLQLKPSATDAQDSAEKFAALKEINSDVCAWITLNGTQIDYPVLKGKDNYTYVNTDVYGNYALAGSIFLDASNDQNFKDSYSLIYGHHMSGRKMFGDLDYYKKQDFFDFNTTGTLILLDRVYELHIFAVVIVPASEHTIFNITPWKNDVSQLLEFVDSNAMFYRQPSSDCESISELKLIAFSTCASDYTDARTVVFATMEENMSILEDK